MGYIFSNASYISCLSFAPKTEGKYFRFAGNCTSADESTVDIHYTSKNFERSC